MNEGTVASVFLIVFREALEASLIVGIIFTVLSKLKQRRYFPHVIWSSVFAIGVSVVAGLGLTLLTSQVRGTTAELIEGAISLIACGVLTYMIFWMNHQAKRIKSEIEVDIERAVTRGELFAIVSLPFLAVLREGAETVLYLYAVAHKGAGFASFVGGAIGLLLAVLIVAMVFIGGTRVPVKALFRWSGFFILLVAAGLLTAGIHEFQELNLLPELYAPLWNLNPILNEKSGIGAFLKSLFGYNGNPSLFETAAYAIYLSIVSYFLFICGRLSKKITPS